MKRKIFSTMIILAGIIIIAYPKASEIYQNYRQQKLMEEWQQSLSIIDEGYENEEDLYGIGIDSTDINADEVESDVIFTEISLEEEKRLRREMLKTEQLEIKRLEREKKQRDDYIKNNMDGILEIEKINLKLPILRGATEKNMLISVASINNTGTLGEIGNYAIAGHRNRTYGRNFNRLDEVEGGDIIYIRDGENNYKYTVVEKLYVLPEEVWVLNGNNMDKEITLITCHPRINPTHRLIVKGKIIE
ncbi:class D sortase [Tissierella sp. Yu-01]|uniref:class D sortase n=1 Tax=Tissierella sp. Yu-01 TaxID=3035694 RepID=UPI00240E8D0B|nr:class D sortase [Tissierella sp. Yu-01]WFA08016.1 class D sortase [Tissierella sp. Yu-01]